MSDKVGKLNRLLKGIIKDLLFLSFFRFNFILGVLIFSC